MTSDDPVLHALSVQPRSARAGETVQAAFRLRNCGSVTSPAGLVRFAVGPGLEPLSPTEIPVDPVAPGAELTASVRARVAPPRVERAEIEVHAELDLAGRVLKSNTARVLVRSRPVFDGPGSGTFVEAVDAETVRVRTVVTNEGDGPAGTLRITVPAPHGCVSAEPDEPARLLLDGLAAGESGQLAFTARIVTPIARIAADDGTVHLSDGRSVAIPLREPLWLKPILAVPAVTLAHARRRVEIGVAVRNDGWVGARGVRVGIALPPGLRPVEGGLTVDGMPLTRGRRGAGTELIATPAKERDMPAVVLAAVPARATVGVALAATFEPACQDGTIRVTVDATDVEVAFAPHRAREVRVRIVDVPHVAAPGDTVTIAARIENTGDLTEELWYAFDDGCGAGEIAPSRAPTLTPGTAANLDVLLTVPPGLPDGARHAAALVVFDAAGERARAAFALPVRRRETPPCSAPVDDGDELTPPEVLADATFALRLVLEVPKSLPAPACASPPPAALPQPECAATAADPMEFRMRLDATRLDEIERLGHGFRAPGLVGHLFALRLFFPESSGHDDGVAAALEAVRDAVRDVYDRLFVKLRIPGYAVSCDDVEDAALRAAIVELLEQLDDGAGGGVWPSLIASPYGAPVVLRALTALLPSRCDDDARLAASIARHAALLDNALAAYEGVPLELFDDALAHRSVAVLDDARDGVLGALSAHIAHVAHSAHLETVC